MKIYEIKGLTLIEVITTAIIAGFVLAGTATYIAFSSRSYNDTVARTNIQSALTMIESTIKTDVQRGSTIIVSNLGQKLEIIDALGVVSETYKFLGNKFIKGASGTDNYIKFANADFAGSFTNKSVKDLEMKVNIKIKNQTNSVIKESGLVTFDVKCRNHSIN